jgi:hypothetical protein
MITELIRSYFKDLARDLAPDLQGVRKLQVSWEDVYTKIYDAHEGLTATLRRNFEELNIQELVNPTDLDRSDLGILSKSLDETDQQGRHIDFPSAPTLQNSPGEARRISG